MRGSASNAAVVAVAMRWTDRLLGVLSVAILARLLTPADFGIIAMASLALGVIEVVLNMGVAAALLQNPHATQEHYDTAWTLRMIQAGATALLAVAAIPFATAYFSEPRLGPVLLVLAASTMISGLENTGVVTFQRDFRAGRDFQYVFFKRLIGLVATLLLAVVFRSYWAMVSGMVLTSVAGVLLSYRLSDMRPRLGLTRLREILGFSSWMLLRNMAVYFNSSLHTLIVGRHASAATLGSYSMANELAAIPSADLLAPLSRVLLPAFAQVRGDAEALKQRFLLAQGVQVLLALPLCVGMALIAADLVPVFLGSGWDAAVGFLQIASLTFGVTTVAASTGYLLFATGRARLSLVSPMLQLAIFCVVVSAFATRIDAEFVVRARLVASLGALVDFLVMVKLALPGLRYGEIVRGLWRPAVAVLAMVTAVGLVGEIVPAGTLAGLAAKVGTGAVVYAAAIVVLWMAAGKPTGAEPFLLNWIRRLVESARIRWYSQPS